MVGDVSILRGDARNIEGDADFSRVHRGSVGRARGNVGRARGNS